jgi:hypothetical protein
MAAGTQGAVPTSLDPDVAPARKQRASSIQIDRAATVCAGSSCTPPLAPDKSCDKGPLACASWRSHAERAHFHAVAAADIFKSSLDTEASKSARPRNQPAKGNASPGAAGDARPEVHSRARSLYDCVGGRVTHISPATNRAARGKKRRLHDDSTHKLLLRTENKTSDDRGCA